MQLTRALELPGAAAWCVCTAARTYEHHGYTDWFPPAQMESIVSKLAVAMDGLRRRQIEAVQVCWVFEHARLLLVQRTNGDSLALFVENRPELDFARHRAALAAFAAGN